VRLNGTSSQSERDQLRRRLSARPQRKFAKRSRSLTIAGVEAACRSP
jgi:hypothetical protein